MVKKTFGIKEMAKHISLKNPDTSSLIAEKLIKSFLDSVIEILQDDGTITFKGFGNFSIIIAQARNGRNPATGEEMKIPSKRRLSFKASKALSEVLNSSQ